MSNRGDLAKFDTGKLSGARTRRGWNQSTTSGLPFWLADPKTSDIRIEDIAEHLSRICRFGGALRTDIVHYSVAQHCCLVSDHCPEGFELEGLLHDAAEAYTGDMIKPIKLALDAAAPGVWKAIEGRVDRTIRLKYWLPPTISPEVKKQDFLAVATEHRDVQTLTSAVDWGQLPEPWKETIEPWSVFRARAEFANRFWRFYHGVS